MSNAALTATCGNPPIPLRSQSDETSPSGTAMFNFLTDLINIPTHEYQKHTSAAKTARATNSLYLSLLPDPNFRRTNSYSAIYTIWSELFNFVKQIPIEHEAMQRLIDFIAELKKIGVQVLHIWRRDIRLWDELPLLNPEFIEEWDQRDGVEWDRLQMFRDKLEANGVYVIHDLRRTVAREN
ncbi:hypothetical protein D6D02_02153 [Aureobasidium pullulans]|nr:hypothetical protein D6D02_02153 [Aureobasidium pullulans]